VELKQTFRGSNDELDGKVCVNRRVGIRTDDPVQGK
jgi:hypothetical protein